MTRLLAIESAYVPSIKLCYDGIDVDILFARISHHTVPENMDLLDDNVLRGLGEKSIRSLNGGSFWLIFYPPPIYSLAILYFRCQGLRRSTPSGSVFSQLHQHVEGCQVVGKE